MVCVRCCCLLFCCLLLCCSLFVVRWSLFVVACELLVVACGSWLVCCWLVVVRRRCRSLVLVRYVLLFVVRCVLFVV